MTIYLDVTSSCKSPLNTGVQRTVRGLYQALSQVLPVTPLRWSEKHLSYCRLPRQEYGFLTRPFAAADRAISDLERRPGPQSWSRIWRHLQLSCRQVDLQRLLGSRDVMLVPEIFQDKRTEVFTAGFPSVSFRTVAIFHDGIPLQRPEWSTESGSRGFEEYIRALARFDRVIAVSQTSREVLLDLWKERKIRGTDVRVEPWPLDDMGKERPSAGNFVAQEILYVATLEPRKNHLALLAAAEMLWCEGMTFRLVLIGRSAAVWGEQVTAEVERLRRLGRKVEWRGHVSDAVLAESYRSCSFTVFPSLAEGFGLPILESLWHGRPCVCASFGAMGEVAQGGGCLLLSSLEEGALAEGLRRLLTDHSRYDQLAAEASNRQFRFWRDYREALLPVLS